VKKLPEEWEIKSIKDLNLDISDGNYSSKYPKQSDFVESGIPFIRANNIKNMTVVIEDMRFISEDQHNELKKGHLKQNDILITTRGDIGQVALVPDSFIGSNINAQIVRIGVSKSIFFKYLAYILTYKETQKDIKGLETGTALKQLPVKKLNLLKIPIPPLEEQKKIAEIFSTVDQKIAFVDNRIEETELLKKGLMQKLLTEGIGHTEFKDSEIGRIPIKWEVSKLGSLTSLTAGGTPSTGVEEYWTPAEVSWLSSGEVNKKIVFNTDNMISEYGLNNSAAKLVPKNSILIALAGQGKTRGTVAITEIELTTNQSVASILPSEKLDMYFLYHNLDSRYEELRLMSTGSGGRGGLNLTILRSVKIALPPLEEQKQISEILSTADKKLGILREKKESFEELKKGLMQKLLTGEVSV